MDMNEACAIRTNLQSASRRHPQPSASARALRFGQYPGDRRTLIQGLLRTLSWALTTTCPEAVNDLGDGNHCRIALMHRFTVNVADAQIALEEFCN